MTRRICFALVLALMLLQPGISQAADRFAVLVGVGKYDPASKVPDRPIIDLKGPPNDLGLMRELLSYYGFNDGNTKVLADAQATRQGIIDAVKLHLLTLPKGALAVFYFSGHGSALKAPDGRGETTDETIVPYDGRIAGQPPRDIVDDEIYDWIEALNRGGVTAVVILDSCFSGGAGRVASLNEKREIPAVEAPPRDGGSGIASLRGGVPGRGAAVAILTASEAREPAQSGLTSKGYQGVFTAALRNALLPSDKAAPPVRWGEAMDRVGAALKIDGTAVQSPRIYGNRDAPIFDSEGPFSNSVEAKRLAVDRAEIGVGSDLGVTEGSVFKLFGPGQIPWVNSDTYEARAKVIKLTSTSAELQVVDGKLLGRDKLAAVEFEYVIPGRKIKVAVPPRGKIRPFDRTAIIAGLGKFGEVGDEPAELNVSLANDRWTLATADGRAVGSGIPAGNSELLRSEIGNRLEDYARWTRLVDWKRRGVGATPQLFYRVSLQTPSGPKLIDGKDIATTKIAAGSQVLLVVENREPRKVRIDVLLLRPNFTIGVCPLGTAENKQALATELLELGAQTGAAAWKVVVSDPEQKLSLMFLANDGARAASNASLEDEFARIWSGAAPRPRALPDTQSFWKTLDIPFQVTAAPAQTTVPAAPKRCLGVEQK